MNDTVRESEFVGNVVDQGEVVVRAVVVMTVYELRLLVSPATQ